MGKYTLLVGLCLVALCAVAWGQGEVFVTEMQFEAVAATGNEDTMYTSTNSVTYMYNTMESKTWPSKDSFKFYYPSSDCSEDCMSDCEEDCEAAAEEGEPCSADKCGKKCSDQCRDPSVMLKTIFRTGSKDESDSETMFGVPHDANGNAYICTTDSGLDCELSDEVSGTEYMASNIRGSTIVPIVSDTNGFKNFAFTAVDGMAKPSAVYLTELHTILEDHDMALNNYHPPAKNMEIDVSGMNGILSPGRPTNTPWCTVLIPESKTAMTNGVASADVFTMNPDLAWLGKYDSRMAPSPYMWGYPVEFRAMYDGSAQAFKRYGMGRLPWTGVACAPDMMTCVGAGDGIMVAYVMSSKMDLTEGRLFFATVDGSSLKWKEFVTKYEVTGDTEETATLSCPYGQECAEAKGSKIGEDAIKAKAMDSSMMMTDMFDVGAAPDADGNCEAGFMMVKKGMNMAADECLKVKADMDTQEGRAIIARLETYRMAAMMGAATNLKMVSGIDSSIDDDWMDGDDSEEGLWFMSFSMVDASLGAEEAFSTNDCGAVYRVTRGSFKEADLDDDALEWDDGELVTAKVSEWMPKKFEMLVGGSKDANMMCSTSAVAHPMDVKWSQYHNTLFIGEMGSTAMGHENTRLWSFEIPYTRDGGAMLKDVGTLKAIAVAPKGASTQGLMWHQNLVYNALSYLTVSFGHPMPTGADATMDDKKGYQTFLGPFPMQGFISGSSDILPNLGCPLWEKGSYKYKAYVSNME